MAQKRRPSFKQPQKTLEESQDCLIVLFCLPLILRITQFVVFLLVCGERILFQWVIGTYGLIVG